MGWDLDTKKNYDLFSLYRFVLNSPVYNVDVLGAAKLVKRLLSIPVSYECRQSNGNYIVFPMGPINSEIGLKVEHSHFLFDDGSDIGYFDDGQVRADDEKRYTYFTVRSGLDDAILRKAIEQTPPKPYKLMPVKFCIIGLRYERDENYDNCHTWANRVLERYEILLKQENQPPQ